MLSSALQSGVQGVHQSIIHMHQAAEKIARAGTQSMPEDDVGDIAESLVDLKMSRNQAQASARVVETASEVLGSLIDIKV